MKLIPTKVIINQNDICFKIGDDTVVYETDVNAFQKNSGLTIQNIDLTLLRELLDEKVYYLKLSTVSPTFSCGNILENILLNIKAEEDNVLLILDFKGVEEVSNSFFKSYTKFLLETSNKVISINMSTIISNEFGNFIMSTILQEEEEWTT